MGLGNFVTDFPKTSEIEIPEIESVISWVVVRQADVLLIMRLLRTTYTCLVLRKRMF